MNYHFFVHWLPKVICYHFEDPSTEKIISSGVNNLRLLEPEHPPLGVRWRVLKNFKCVPVHCVSDDSLHFTSEVEFFTLCARREEFPPESTPDFHLKNSGGGWKLFLSASTF